MAEETPRSNDADADDDGRLELLGDPESLEDRSATDVLDDVADTRGVWREKTS